jgi:hypothetical protein
MLSELRHARRVLLKAPGFSALVVGVLAAGIGGTPAMFSVVNGVLLTPLPFADVPSDLGSHPGANGTARRARIWSVGEPIVALRAE